ncbi:MAG: hypothetical protein AAF367_08085 [Pseudomonadota bacterium]
MSASSHSPKDTARPVSPSVRLLVSEAAATAGLFNTLAGAPAAFDEQIRNQIRAFQSGLSHVASAYGAAETTAQNLNPSAASIPLAPKRCA